MGALVWGTVMVREKVPEASVRTFVPCAAPERRSMRAEVGKVQFVEPSSKLPLARRFVVDSRPACQIRTGFAPA